MTAAATRVSTWDFSAKRRARPRAVKVAARAGYELREGAEPMLKDAPWLVPFIDETCAELRKIFGSESEFALERFDDPESFESPPKLFLLVKTRHPAEVVVALMHRFDEEWWLDNAERGREKLQVSVEFI
jgi:hypothetical protein